MNVNLVRTRRMYRYYHYFVTDTYVNLVRTITECKPGTDIQISTYTRTTYIDTYIYTYIHTYIHTYIPVYI